MIAVVGNISNSISETVLSVYHMRHQCRALPFSVPMIVLGVARGWRPYHLPAKVILIGVQVALDQLHLAPGARLCGRLEHDSK